VGVPTLVTLGSGVLLLTGAVIAQALSSDSGLSSSSAFFAGGGLGLSSVGGVMLYFDLTPPPSALKPSPPRVQVSAVTSP
jgi:hypothetical protein